MSASRIYKTDKSIKITDVPDSSYGIRNIIRKKRYLYIHKRTLIHRVVVYSIGEFIELEDVHGGNDDLIKTRKRSRMPDKTARHKR